MADKLCFVQLPHPGAEHVPDSHTKISWNQLRFPHKRKFLQTKGDWLDENGRRHSGNLRFWCEWEPESELLHRFNPRDRGPHHPLYLWKPYWTPRNSYDGLHNTDPFVFGDRFLYSNCLQSATLNRGPKHLKRGSIIAFGSKVKSEKKWALDTLLVVKDSIRFDPRSPRTSLEGEVSETFLCVTGGPLVEDPKRKDAATKGVAQEFTLYRGATPDDPVCGMFSFFPAVPASRNSGFPRPPIVASCVINPKSTQNCKGLGQERTFEELRCLWDSLVRQVRKQNLVLGVRAELPESRME